jgi:DNA-binding response OmpR family regulator
MTTILVVDDSPTVGSTVEWMLRTYGFTVRIARDGISALSALRTYTPDLILLDIRMPHVDGIQVCKLIRNDPTYDTVPVVMLSGLTDQGAISQALSAGANDYITKPVNDATLVMVIEQQLSMANIAAAH